MKTRINLICCFLLFVLFSLPLRAGVILVHGDSLSAGYGLASGEEWPALLQQRLAQSHPDYRVVNSSISGETSAGGLARFAALLEQHKPTIVILELGANDGLRGQSLTQMEKNLAQMIAASHEQQAQVMLLGIRIPPNYGTRYSNAFHQVYFSLQQRYQLPLVPFFLENVAGHDELMQQDGLHPTAEAQPVILENVWKSLAGLLQPAR